MEPELDVDELDEPELVLDEPELEVELAPLEPPAPPELLDVLPDAPWLCDPELDELPPLSVAAPAWEGSA